MADSTTGTMAFDNDLLPSVFPVITDSGTLVSGQDLSRMAVLGKITASGKLTQLDKDAVDGSAVPYAVLKEDCDASGGDAACSYYLTGAFNSAKLTFVSGTVIADVKDTMRNINLYAITLESMASAT